MQREHKLVTSGPYSVIRHSAYTGFALAVVGMLMSQMLPGGERVHEPFPSEDLHVRLDDMVHHHDTHHAEADIYRG